MSLELTRLGDAPSPGGWAGYWLLASGLVG